MTNSKRTNLFALVRVKIEKQSQLKLSIKYDRLRKIETRPKTRGRRIVRKVKDDVSLVFTPAVQTKIAFSGCLREEEVRASQLTGRRALTSLRHGLLEDYNDYIKNRFERVRDSGCCFIHKV